MNNTTATINQQLKHSTQLLEAEHFKLLAALFAQAEITTAQLQSAIDALNLIISIRKNAGKGIL